MLLRYFFYLVSYISFENKMPVRTDISTRFRCYYIIKRKIFCQIKKTPRWGGFLGAFMESDLDFDRLVEFPVLAG